MLSKRQWTRKACFGRSLGGVLSFLTILALSSPSLCAQMGTGTLLGTIRQESGDFAPDVEVAIQRIETNETFRLLTNLKGDYRRGGLPPGSYKITASLPGYGTQVRTHVQLLVGQIQQEDFRLLMGDLGATQSTRSQSVFSGSNREDLGQVIDQEKLESLPVNTRDMGQLASLAAGAAPSSESRSRSVKVLGMRRNDNLTYIDGTLFTHGDGSAAFQASPDALTGPARVVHPGYLQFSGWGRAHSNSARGSPGCRVRVFPVAGSDPRR